MLQHQVQPDVTMVSTDVSLYEREIAQEVLPRQEYLHPEIEKIYKRQRPSSVKK